MSITFGSVGDIIAVGQIAWSLARALTDSKGSAKEYQCLIKELKTFDQALLQVVALWQNYEPSPELDQLGGMTKEAVKEWRDTLLAFRVKIDRKYAATLGASGSGSWIKDAGKRVVWLKEKEDILDLRRKLGSASDTITLLTLATMGKSTRLAESTMECRVQAVHCLLLESKTMTEEHLAQLKKIEKRMKSQSKSSDLILRYVKFGVMTLTHLDAMIVDIKNTLSLFQSYMISQHLRPRSLVTGWQQDPVTLEDALGFRIPLPLELVTSWEMFDTILRKHFEKRRGHQKVLNGEFAIEEAATGNEVSREHEFCITFRPGQKIDMSMIFLELKACNHCPRCGNESKVSVEIRTQCTSCTLWFQRLVEINESDPELPEPEIPELPEPESLTKRTGAKESRVPLPSPADFQRVRLLSTYQGDKSGRNVIGILSNRVIKRLKELDTMQESRLRRWMEEGLSKYESIAAKITLQPDFKSSQPSQTSWMQTDSTEGTLEDSEFSQLRAWKTFGDPQSFSPSQDNVEDANTDLISPSLTSDSDFAEAPYVDFWETFPMYSFADPLS